MVFFAVVVMARYRRARVAGGTYFFTVVTERRQRLLVLPEVRAALRVRAMGSGLAIQHSVWRFGLCFACFAL